MKKPRPHKVSTPLSYAPAMLPEVEAAPRRPVMVALACGLVAWALLWGFQDIQAAPALQFNLGIVRWILIVAIAAVAALPAVSLAIASAMARLENLTAPGRAKLAVVIGIAATLYLILTAHLQGRDLFPKTHDDQSYLLQIQMLAKFRLWMPQHPLADFFDTFYVITKPVYASLYFPGAAMLYVPTAWLGLPTWLMPAIVAGACVGLTYRIVAEVVDGFSGILAAMALVSLEYFRVFSVLLTSHEPMLLMGLLTTWAWLRWRVSGSFGKKRYAWALAIGVFAGWGAITRPADAVCFALPIGVAMVIAMVRARRRGAASDSPTLPPRFLPTAALIVAGAAPFLALQAVFNKGVTGNWLETPYTYYLRHDQPNTAFGFHAYDPAVRPASTNRKKHDYYDQFFAPYILRHQPVENLRWWGRVYLPMTVDTTLPARLMLPLAFVGAMVLLRRANTDSARTGATGRRYSGDLCPDDAPSTSPTRPGHRSAEYGRPVAPKPSWFDVTAARVVVGVVPLFLVVYYLNTFFLEHYAILIAPAMLLLTVLGIRTVAAAWPAIASRVRSAISVAMLTTSILILPEFNPIFPGHQTGDETVSSPFMVMAKQQLPAAADLKKPAILLFTYRFGDPLIDEPVYNSDVAWPDDAEVIYAHDLGPRNIELFRYYAERQPERVVYRIDRVTGLTEPKSVRELVAEYDGK